MTDDVWYAADTTPAAIEAALRGLLASRHRRMGFFAPARVLNLVTIVDAHFSGEVENRLGRLRASHPSRLILCKVGDDQVRLNAIASIGSEGDDPGTAGVSVGREKVELTMAPRHVRALASIVAPLLVRDLPTVVWAPHGYAEGIEAMRRHAQVVLLDSRDEPDVQRALARADDLFRHMEVVDLSWLRSAPWRERVAGSFDPPELRASLQSIAAVTVRHQRDSSAAGLLFCGWLASRLGWRPASLTPQGGERVGRLRARRGEVSVKLQAVEQASPGLCGVDIQTAAGASISLDRAPGGLCTVRRARDGSEQRWMVLGASRGEAGILANGVRHALVRDHIYKPAMQAAHAMVS